MPQPFKLYPTYKPSGVPWLGDIPAHWEVQRLKQAATLNPSRTEARMALESDTPVAFIPMERVGTDGKIDEEILHVSAGWNGFTYFRRNDVIVAKITPCFENGKGACLDSLSTEIGFGSTEFHVLRAKSLLAPQFLYHVTTLTEFRRLGADAMTGAAGQQRVPQEFVSNYPIAIPPLPEQTAIVRYLDHADERIRRYISGKQKLIRLLEEEKQAVIHRAVTRGLDPNVRLKDSGVEWLGEVPAHWEVMPLRRVAISRCDGPFGSGLKSSHYTDQGIRVVRLQNIGHAQFNNSNPAFIAPSHYATLGDHTVEPEDLLIAGLGDDRHPAGRACVAPSFIVPAMVKADCFRFRLFRQRINPEFAALQLTATAGDASSLLSTGATRQRTNLQATAARPIAVPPIEEQSSIVGYLDKATADIDTAISRTRRQIELLQEYRTRLIADVVTGQLDVREAAANLPDEVNASEPPETVGEPHRRAYV